MSPSLRATPPRERVDRMFQAFCSRTRLRILHALSVRECCYGDLAKILRLDRATVARHVARLRKGGLVGVRKGAHCTYYSLAPARLPVHARLLECLTCLFGEVPEIRSDTARVQRLARLKARSSAVSFERIACGERKIAKSCCSNE